MNGEITSADIKALRERRGMTQCQLADALGVKQSTISRIESGRMEPRGPIRLLLGRMVAEADKDTSAGRPE